MNRNIFASVFLFVALGLIVVLAFASVVQAEPVDGGQAIFFQGDPEPEETPGPTGNPELDQRIEQFGTVIFEAVFALVTLSFATPFTTLVTNILKKYIPTSISASVIHLALSVVVFLAYAIFTKYGQAAGFEQFIGIAFTILSALAPILGIHAEGHAIYNFAKSRDLSLWGYRRPTDPSLRAVRARG